KVVDVRAYQGEDSLAANNKKIADFPVDGIPEAPAGEEEIKVKFAYNLNGMLEIEITIMSTGKKVIKKINHSSMKDDEKSAAKKRLDSEWKDSSMAEEVETLIERAETIKGDLETQPKEELNNVLKELKRALIEENENRVDEYEDKLTDILFDLI
ncbi:MAG: Hsp70 family protein, partial [Candidatus Woesearchaeota archaeon]